MCKGQWNNSFCWNFTIWFFICLFFVMTASFSLSLSFPWLSAQIIIETLIEFRVCWTKNNSKLMEESAEHYTSVHGLLASHYVYIKLTSLYILPFFRIYLFVNICQIDVMLHAILSWTIWDECHVNLASTEQVLQIEGYLQITFVFMHIWLDAIALNVFLWIPFFSEQKYAIQFNCWHKNLFSKNCWNQINNRYTSS